MLPGLVTQILPSASAILLPVMRPGGNGAITEQTGKAPIPVKVDTDGVDRYSPEVESAVYFSVLEAMQNVGKYANASQALVSLRIEEGDLSFSVSDDGDGFRTDTTPYGMGLQNMADRLAAIGGALDVRAQPGRGTRISGRIPGVAGPRREDRS